MLKPIAEIQIIEKVKGKDMTTSVNLFSKNDKLKIIRKAGNSSATVFEGSVDEFLRRLHWNSQFVDYNKLPPLKEWRK